MKNNIDLTKSPKGIGFAGFLTWLIPMLLLIAIIVVTKIIAPCQIAGGAGNSGWTQCNNSAGDTAMFTISLLTIGYTFLILPAAFIVGVVSLAQKADIKWAWIAMSPAIVAVFSMGLFPFGLMSLLDNF